MTTFWATPGKDELVHCCPACILWLYFRLNQGDFGRDIVRSVAFSGKWSVKIALSEPWKGEFGNFSVVSR